MIAICLGGAPSVWDDLEKAKALVGDHMLVACNHAAIEYPGHLDVWATLHCELLTGWLSQRDAAGRNVDCLVVTHKPHPGVDAKVVPMTWYGSSGLFMAEAAFALGASGVILCGVPLESDAGHIAERGPWVDPTKYREGVLQAQADGANIRSMSGWTAQALGQPDTEWIQSCGPDGENPVRRRQQEKREASMRVRFLKDRNWTPPEERRITVAYKSGMELTVKRSWGEQMVKDGDAVEIDAPPRPVEKKPLTPAQIKALDGDGDGKAGGSLPKALR